MGVFVAVYLVEPVHKNIYYGVVKIDGNIAVGLLKLLVYKILKAVLVDIAPCKYGFKNEIVVIAVDEKGQNGGHDYKENGEDYHGGRECAFIAAFDYLQELLFRKVYFVYIRNVRIVVWLRLAIRSGVYINISIIVFIIISIII